MRVKDKVAIVVGGASGIGRAVCQALVKEGAKLLVADLVIEGAKKLVDELKSSGHEAMAMKVDMRSTDEANEMVKATLDYYGQIDILANVVGGSAVVSHAAGQSYFT